MRNVHGTFRIPAPGDEMIFPFAAAAPDQACLLNARNDGSAVGDGTELPVLGAQSVFTQAPTFIENGGSGAWADHDVLGGGLVVDAFAYIRLHTQTSGNLALDDNAVVITFRATSGRRLLKIGDSYVYILKNIANDYWVASIWHTGGYVNLTSAIEIPTDGSLHTFILSWKKDPAAGLRQFWTDGVPSPDNAAGIDTSDMLVLCEAGFEIAVTVGTNGVAGTIYSCALLASAFNEYVRRPKNCPEPLTPPPSAETGRISTNGIALTLTGSRFCARLHRSDRSDLRGGP